MWPEDPAHGLTVEERAIHDLLREAHLAADHDLPELFTRHASALGVRDPVAYVADLQQRVLVPFLDTEQPSRENPGVLTIDATLAGRAYQHVEVLTQALENTVDELRVWLPMLDGTERLGLLAVTLPSRAWDDHAVLESRLLLFAAMAAELIMTKTMYGDTLVRMRRTSEMSMTAEMQWSLLPPLTFATVDLTITGGLEPAYEVAGDTIDYAVDRNMARLAIFDGMGHGLASAQLTTLTVAAYRNARRSGKDLMDTVAFVDRAVIEKLPELVHHRTDRRARRRQRAPPLGQRGAPRSLADPRGPSRQGAARDAATSLRPGLSEQHDASPGGARTSRSRRRGRPVLGRRH